MRPADVHEIIGYFDRAGVDVWLVGGWGVDALLGARTRDHEDIDVSFDLRSTAVEAACAVLEAEGFQVIEQLAGGRWFPRRVALRDGGGRRVELLPVMIDPDADSISRHADGIVYPAAAVTIGAISGEPVPCLALPFQRQVHEGYELRPVDREDLAWLAARYPLPRPPAHEG